MIRFSLAIPNVGTEGSEKAEGPTLASIGPGADAALTGDSYATSSAPPITMYPLSSH